MKKLLLAASLFFAVAPIVFFSYIQGVKRGEQNVRDEAEIYADVCYDLKNMKLDEFNRLLGMEMLKQAGINDVREALIYPLWDCERLEYISNYGK